MKTLKDITFTLSMALAGTSVMAQETVMVGEPGWPGARIMASIIGTVMETRLGVEVGYAPGSNAVIFASMDGGRGDIDIHPDVWLPNQASFDGKPPDATGEIRFVEGLFGLAAQHITGSGEKFELSSQCNKPPESAYLSTHPEFSGYSCPTTRRISGYARRLIVCNFSIMLANSSAAAGRL
ncbi:MAG: glycine betaine ABC transporter substrate-binding protein [Yoonia sp.]